MNNMTKWLVLLALTLAPLSAAHDGGVGAPKSHCETPGSDTGHHEYGPPGSGFVIFLGLDGSVPPCPYGDTTWDGHIEFAFGGTWLQAAVTLCTEAYADHTPAPFISVYDAVLTPLGSDVAFSVYADTLNNDPIPSEPNCGDFESDYGVDCVNHCTPAFPPGLDGSYQVYVSGTTGHIYAGNGERETPPGHITIHGTGNTVAFTATPPGWTCTGVAPGDPAPNGQTISITCTPPEGHAVCTSVDVVASAVGGGPASVHAHSSCVFGPIAHAIANADGTGSGSAFGNGVFPWTCDVTLDGPPNDWWVGCNVNTL